MTLYRKRKDAGILDSPRYVQLHNVIRSCEHVPRRFFPPQGNVCLVACLFCFCESVPEYGGPLI